VGEVLSRTQIVERARQHVGHREVAPNRSPLIDEWLRRCWVSPGLPWCAAFASWCVETLPGTARPGVDGTLNRELRCAGALKLGRMFEETRNPQPGDLMWFATDAKGAGHIGIVAAGVGLDEVLCIEGNSADGVRYVRRLRSEVRFSCTRPGEHCPLPASDVDAPLVHVSYEGTR
jgi:hypothetical protein